MDPLTQHSILFKQLVYGISNWICFQEFNFSSCSSYYPIWNSRDGLFDLGLDIRYLCYYYTILVWFRLWPESKATRTSSIYFSWTAVHYEMCSSFQLNTPSNRTFISKLCDQNRVDDMNLMLTDYVWMKNVVVLVMDETWWGSHNRKRAKNMAFVKRRPSVRDSRQTITLSTDFIKWASPVEWRIYSSRL